MYSPDRFKPGYKVWLEWDGTVFGDGLFKLLKLIHEMGSISAAAREMNMSYRAAWGRIKTAQKRWQIELVVTQVGGEQGGGATLTPPALELIKRYSSFRQQVDGVIEELFKESFALK
ncbi:winged helix-turn-helix domain-containing protein [Desulfofalx alkaliphila]|uniref:winged helix-turn-helix domain-containing protein n=1 Tax=Desulfofalx alkaliphila TaxID=105483 RepID=UPI0004E1FF47|nr:LysR family transcriptional regulator [Desulfofalx alkaliphila]